MNSACKFGDAVLEWIGLELLTPEWNKAFKKLWVDFPEEMERAKNNHRMKPSGFYDVAVARAQNEKEARRKFNCGTSRCNGTIMCDNHYRQFVGVYD